MNKDWKFVKCHNFIKTDDKGALNEILCKVCGTTIAGISEVLSERKSDSAGNVIEVRHRSFSRFHNYAELKMQFTNGSFHVTNGCSKCLSTSLKSEQLQEMYWADYFMNPTGFAPNDVNRVATKAVQVLVGGGIT